MGQEHIFSIILDAWFHIYSIWLTIYIVIILGANLILKLSNTKVCSYFTKLVSNVCICLTHIFCLLHPEIGHKNILKHNSIKYKCIQIHMMIFLLYSLLLVDGVYCSNVIMRFGLMPLPDTRWSPSDNWFVELSLEISSGMFCCWIFPSLSPYAFDFWLDLLDSVFTSTI